MLTKESIDDIVITKNILSIKGVLSIFLKDIDSIRNENNVIIIVTNLLEVFKLECDSTETSNRITSLLQGVLTSFHLINDTQIRIFNKLVNIHNLLEFTSMYLQSPLQPPIFILTYKQDNIISNKINIVFSHDYHDIKTKLNFYNEEHDQWIIVPNIKYLNELGFRFNDVHDYINRLLYQYKILDDQFISMISYNISVDIIRNLLLKINNEFSLLYST